MLDFIYMGSVDLRGAHGKRKMKYEQAFWKYCISRHVPYEPQQSWKGHNFGRQIVFWYTNGTDSKKVQKGYSSDVSVLCQENFIYQISSEYLKRLHRKVQKSECLQRAISHVKEGQARQNWNLVCITSRQIHIHVPNFKSLSEKMAEKRTENCAKGNNSCKSRSSTAKLELDLYYVKTNSYTKFQVNIWKDGRGKSGKLNFIKGQ